MNTQKQITAMVTLMFLGILSLGAYVWFESGTRAEAKDQQAIESSVRGAHLFANNCRTCHGNAGVGSVGNPALIGVPLNKPDNTRAFRDGDANALAVIQARIRDTITCGRNGTAMPPWSIDQGGSLAASKIENLAKLITTNAGNAWAIAEELAIEQDIASLANLRRALADAQAEGDQTAIDVAQKRVDDAQARFDQGLPILPPAVSVTANTCGQRSASAPAAGGGTAAEAPAADVDEAALLNGADPARGQDLFFANGCNVCHGDTGGGTIGPTIAQTGFTLAQVIQQYRTPRAAMPPFPADKIPDQDIAHIYAWLQTLPLPEAIVPGLGTPTP